jgi:NAD(P)-dependent dehydrogenase (short-subunit alcohol dehydrogenase family)
MTRFDLSGKVAIVTGGSRGLGREMVLGFAEAGATVVIVSRKLGACEAVAEEVRAKFGTTALPLSCHVGKWSEIDTMLERVYGTFPQVDILVNNAGLSPLYSRESAVTEELFDKVIDINLKGPFRLTALVGERMADAGVAGSIINISSMAAVSPQPKTMPYTAAKAGLNALTLAYSRELGPSVRVNAIMCGPFFTDVSQHWDMDAFAEVVKSHALKRGGEPSEIIGTALYLASSASSFTTGAVIPVSGGQP